jgi:hypothetical protein
LTQPVVVDSATLAQRGIVFFGMLFILPDSNSSGIKPLGASSVMTSYPLTTN